MPQPLVTLEDVRSKALVRIVDDDASLADALRFFLEVEGWNAVVYTRAKAFFAEDRPSVPGCVVLDVRMPELTGLECQRLLNEHRVALPVIFMSGHGDIDMAVQAMIDGAVDFLQKPVDEERLLRDIVKAATASVQAAEGTLAPEEAARRWSQLTEREAAVARLVAQSLTARVIGERLGISARTAEVHRANLLRKLGVKEVAEVRQILRAVEGG